MQVLKIGVTGYSVQKFDHQAAKNILSVAFQYCKSHNGAHQINVVSGLTNMGIPGLAYQLASESGYLTTGIACSKANDFPCYPVDSIQLVGEDWGDESSTFLNYIDVLIRVGGGAQAISEADLAKSQGLITMEFDLPAIKGT